MLLAGIFVNFELAAKLLFLLVKGARGLALVDLFVDLSLGTVKLLLLLELQLGLVDLNVVFLDLRKLVLEPCEVFVQGGGQLLLLHGNVLLQQTLA